MIINISKIYRSLTELNRYKLCNIEPIKLLHRYAVYYLKSCGQKYAKTHEKCINHGLETESVRNKPTESPKYRKPINSMHKIPAVVACIENPTELDVVLSCDVAVEISHTSKTDIWHIFSNQSRMHQIATLSNNLL